MAVYVATPSNLFNIQMCDSLQNLIVAHHHHSSPSAINHLALKERDGSGRNSTPSRPFDANRRRKWKKPTESRRNRNGYVPKINSPSPANWKRDGNVLPAFRSRFRPRGDSDTGYGRDEPFPCIRAVVKHLEDAHELIDTAISTALKESKPVYISICCNLIPHPTFNREPVPFTLSPTLSNEMGLEAAIEAAAEFLNKAVKPVMVGGPKLRVANACKAFMELANSSDYVFAVMPSGKGLVPEHHPHFIGTYWGSVSTSFCAEIIESADSYLFVGPVFNDFNSVGYSLSLSIRKRQSFCSLIEL